MNLFPCSEPGCPCLCAPYSKFCAVHRKGRPANFTCPCAICQKNIKVGQFVTSDDFGRYRHIGCREKGI